MAHNKLSGVYCITNLANNSKYIGSSIDICRRWTTHLRELRKGVHGNQKLQRAWNKYGENMFEYSILILCSEKDTLLHEQQFLDDIKPEYNIATNATASLLGAKLSEEHKQKIGQKNKGHIMSEEQKHKLSEAHKGKKWSAEQHAKMDGRMPTTRGLKHTAEQNERNRQTHLGKKLTDETKQKISEAGKHRIVSEETKNKIRNAQRGKVIPEETRQKISATLTGRTCVFTDEHKEHLRDAWKRRRNGSSTK